MVLYPMKEEWRSVLASFGEQSVMIGGIVMMPWLCVDNLVTIHMVKYYIYIGMLPYNNNYLYAISQQMHGLLGMDILGKELILWYLMIPIVFQINHH